MEDSEKKKHAPLYVQQLLGDDVYSLRVEFVRWMLDGTQNDSQILSTILLFNEVNFTREDVVSTHNMHK